MNKLGHYIFKRICKDQGRLRKRNSMNMYGLYVTPKDIQGYVNDYTNYGIDYTGDDNISADDKVEHYLEDFLEPNVERYWDDADGEEL